jgi:hypothetical protein
MRRREDWISPPTLLEGEKYFLRERSHIADHTDGVCVVMVAYGSSPESVFVRTGAGQIMRVARRDLFLIGRRSESEW